MTIVSNKTKCCQQQKISGMSVRYKQNINVKSEFYLCYKYYFLIFILFQYYSGRLLIHEKTTTMTV